MSRVVAGEFGGRRLVVPAGSRTRPTSDRVREALFSALEHLDCVAGATVLDLFAGSGALGLEALSRGAEALVLVDADRAAVAACRANITALGVGDRSRVSQRSVATFLSEAPTEFDLVLLDPPYDVPESSVTDVLGALVDGWLAEEAVVVVERSSRSPEPAWPDGLAQFRQHRYGETLVWLAEPSTSAVDDLLPTEERP